ncbi:MAG: SCO family protein [Rhodospirillales bacterium]
MNGMKVLRYVLWGLCGAVGIGLGVLAFRAFEQGTAPGQQISQAGKFGVPFSLVRHNGEPVDETLFEGKPSLVYFGFTFCPDVCPTTLTDMTVWADALGDDADRVNLVFVTVDPERDTAGVMSNYITSFSDRIIGVTGEPEAVKDMLRGYKVYFSKVPLEGGDYTMDHTAGVYILDRQGDFAGTIAYGASEADALAKIRKTLDRS